MIIKIKQNSIAPTNWNLGRIIKTYSGGDGIVRMVTVQISTGTEVKEFITKLYWLPTEDFQNVKK